MFTFARRWLTATVMVALFSPGVASASDLPGSVHITVKSADGTPIPVAHVILRESSHVHNATTGTSGQLTMGELEPGTYSVSARAAGFTDLRDQPLAIGAGSPTEVELTLARSASSLTTIGSVTANGSATVSTASAPTQSLRAQEYAARGYTRVSDMLVDALSTTVIPQGSGSAAAPRSVALRGPDPTETLVDIDGHELNNGISGDFDLSLLDPADFESVQLVYGIAPSSLLSPSTIGGAINVRTLEPTRTPHGLFRLSAGNFASTGATFQATGTENRLGYAFSLHQANSANDVSHATVNDAQGQAFTVGSDVDSQTALGKVRYAFGGDGGGYGEVTIRDQSVVRDLSGALTSLVAPGTYASSPNSRLLGHNAGYGLDVELPLAFDRSTGIASTTAIVRHLTSYATQSVEGRASGSSPTYFNDRDTIADDTLELDRTFAKGSVAVKFRLRSERLDTFDPSLAGAITEQSLRRSVLRESLDYTTAATPSTTVSGLAQTQRSAAIRFAYDPSARLHYTAAAYYSDFSIFGRSLDPRVGIVWTPSAATAVRASLGTTFQSPQLTELSVPATLPAPDANGRISIGNPNLKADHATEFDLGFDQLIGRKTRLAADVYRTNLRTPAQRFLPAATCAPNVPDLSCASFPINIGSAVYTGAEVRLDRTIDTYSVLHVGLGVDSTYALDAPAVVQNGSLVAHEQFLGVPLMKATLAFEHRVPVGLNYHAGFVYEGRYNELNRAPFATLRAGASQTIGQVEFALSGTNLTNVYATRFTQAGQGVAYGGTDGPIATDAYALPGRAITFSLTRRF